MPSIAIMGSGNGSNAQALIDAVDLGLLNATISCILSDVENSKILERAKKHNIPYHYINCDPSPHSLRDDAENIAIKILDDYQVDFIILAGFMRIIKDRLLHKFPNRVINIHPSLLPAFPGLDAGKQAFEAGAKETGCTIHYVDKGIDSGKIILQKTVQIESNETIDSLMIKIHKAEHIAYPEALNLVFSKKS